MPDLFDYGFDKHLYRTSLPPSESDVMKSGVSELINPLQIQEGTVNLGRIQLLPDVDTGILAKDDSDNEILKVITGGTNVGDVVIGDYSGGAGVEYDKSGGTFTIKGTLSATGGTLGTITAGTITGATIKTATAEASNRIYLIDNYIRFMKANTADANYEMEIDSSTPRISFYEVISSVHTEQSRLSSADDYFLIQRYDNSGSSAASYFFYDDKFVGSGEDLGASGTKWKDAYFSGTINTDKVSIAQTSTSGNSLLIDRDLPNTDTDSPVVQLLDDNLSDDQKVLAISNDGSGDALYIYNRDTTHTSNPKGLNILSYSNDNSLYIDQSSNSASEEFAVYIRCNNSGAGAPGGIDMSSFSAGEAVMALVADATDPTSGGGAATGRVAVSIDGSIKYLAYY